MAKNKDKIMNKIKNYGFVAPVITQDNYVFGGGNVPEIVIRENGDWTDLPDKEIQHKDFDTYNCTGFNTLAQIEKLEYILTGEKVNYSDRFLGIVAGTRPPGNDPNTVAEAIRKYGCIPESMLPFSNDLKNTDEYYSFKGADEKVCREAGKKWLEKFTFLHEWVFSEGDSNTIKKDKLLKALKMSPLGVGVYAWEKKGNRYVDDGKQPNHWTGNVKGVLNDKWIANDTYIDNDGDTLKDLAWDFRFTYPKRYYLELRKVTEKKIGIIQSLIKTLLSLIGLMKKEGLTEIPTEIPVNKSVDSVDKPETNPSVTQMAEAIKTFEGWSPPNAKYPNGTTSWRNKNAGNIKGKDGKFLKFETAEKGFQYLCEYIRRVQKNAHPAYSKNCSIRSFFLTYAPKEDSNFPIEYGIWVSSKLGVTPDFLIKNLI